MADWRASVLTINIGDTIKFTTSTPNDFSSTTATPIVRVENVTQGTDGHKIIWCTPVPPTT